MLMRLAVRIRPLLFFVVTYELSEGLSNVINYVYYGKHKLQKRKRASSCSLSQVWEENNKPFLLP